MLAALQDALETLLKQEKKQSTVAFCTIYESIERQTLGMQTSKLVGASSTL